MIFRKKEEPAPDGDESAVDFAQRTVRGFRRKADHNKTESILTFLGVLVPSLVAPIFITLGTGLVWGKIVPVVLSLCASFASAWLQLRKPQQLWAIYRSAQRYIEHHLNRYRYSIGPYARAKDKDHKDRLLAKHIDQIALMAHEMWVPLIPSADALDKAADASQRKKADRLLGAGKDADDDDDT